MRRIEVEHRIDRNDPVRIYAVVTEVIVADDVVKIHRLGDAVILE